MKQNIFIKNASQNIIVFLSLVLFPLWAEVQSDTSSFRLDYSEKIPNVPSFTLDFKKQKLVCSPHKLIWSKTHKNIIEFFCSKKNSVLLTDTNIDLKPSNTTGRNQTKTLRREIKEKQNAKRVYKIQIPQDRARHPKAARRIAKKQLNNDFYGKYARAILPAKLYASVRPQVLNIGFKDGVSLEDAGSRAGFFYYYSFDNNYTLTLQYEGNINWHHKKKFINLSDLSDSSRRLSFISLEQKEVSILFGKYWSAYYDVAQFTDKFMAFGASGSGAFNNHSDGSASGTGRADNMLQFHIDKENYNSTLQYQLSHSDDAKEYSYGLAGSFLYKGWKDTKIGTSLAFGKFKDITQSMHTVGINGDDISWITGLSYQKEKFTMNAVFSYTKNHMNDDQGIYFDSIGTELYLQYDVSESIRLAGGLNTLMPKDDDYKGNFNIKKLILSAQYTFGEKTFNDLVYMEVSLPKGNLANGDDPSPNISIGLRYLFNIL